MNTTAPEKITEIKFVTVLASLVHVGDIIATGAERDTIVHSVKVGTKWVELRNNIGKLIMRVEAATELTVGREFETDESKAARERAFRNEAIRKSVAKKDVNSNTLKALAALTEQAEKGYIADSFKTSALLAAQAEDKVADGFGAFVTNNVGRVNKETGEVIDETAAWEAYIEVLKERLLGRSYDMTRGLSRSTSVVSNVMDDAEREATVEFVRHGGGWFF